MNPFFCPFLSEISEICQYSTEKWYGFLNSALLKICDSSIPQYGTAVLYDQYLRTLSLLQYQCLTALSLLESYLYIYLLLFINEKKKQLFILYPEFYAVVYSVHVRVKCFRNTW